MEVVKNPYFYFPCILFWINQAVEKWIGYQVPLIYSYLDDLLAMPVILGITLQIFQWIHPKKRKFRFTKTQTLVGFAYVSIIFEGFLPFYSSNYTKDLFDVFCYGVGTLVFYLKINPPKLL